MGAGATSSIHRQLFGGQGIDAQDQIPPGLGWPFMGARGTARGDLAAMLKLRIAHLQLQRSIAGGDRDTRFAAQVQLIHADLSDRRRDQQCAVVRHIQAFELQNAGAAGQTHQRVGFNTDTLGQGDGADQQGQQKNLTHDWPPCSFH